LEAQGVQHAEDPGGNHLAEDRRNERLRRRGWVVRWTVEEALVEPYDTHCQAAALKPEGG